MLVLTTTHALTFLILCSIDLFIKTTALDKKRQQKVLLVSLDGFRWDFWSKEKTPNLEKIVQTGVSVEYVLNVFPTTTLPNHQSIVTGLYTENHGMIDNTFFNPINGRIFNEQSDEEWWSQSTPIWIVNQKQGHQSGVCFWPGYKVRYENVTPAFTPSKIYRAPYMKDQREVMTIKERIKLVFDWLEHDDITFVALYTETADKTAHDHVPDSNKTKNIKVMKNAIKTVDETVQFIRDEITQKKLETTINVIFIGDHGHVNTTFHQELSLDDYIDPKKGLRYTNGFTDVFLYTYFNETESVYSKLENASKQANSHFKVYLKKDIPNYFHVKKNNNTGDILILPELGWIMTSSLAKVPYLKGKWERGEHGYSNFERKMSPGFFAFGPMFREGFRKRCIKTIDLYSLMCHILQIKARKNDGNFNRVKPLLKEFSNLKDEDPEFDIDIEDPIVC